MSFRWDFVDAGGAPAGRSREFFDREAAEAWIGEEWEELRERGVEEVVLAATGEDDPVYRMSLRPGP